MKIRILHPARMVDQLRAFSSRLKDRFLRIRAFHEKWWSKAPLPLEPVHTTEGENPENTPEKPGRFSRKSKLLLLLAAVPVLALTLGSIGFWGWIHQLDIPFPRAGDAGKVIWIAPGSHTQQILQQLVTEGIIPSSRRTLAYAYLWWNDNRGGLKAGEYRFAPSPSLREVLEILIQGKVHYRTLTIPEGWDLRQIGEILVSKGFGTLQEIRSLLANPEPIQELDPRAVDLEGYLFPDTYFYTRGTSAREMITRMVQRFQSAFPPAKQNRAREMGFSLRDMVVLASLIERETSLPVERPLVSAVFHRRLKLGMRLQCDPTVVYASSRIGKYDGVIRQSDLNLDSPYNTYRFPGLPPGPIASPGEASLEAALHPAENNYLYFVAKGDGGHQFSANLTDHNQAVQLYQRMPTRRDGIVRRHVR